MSDIPPLVLFLNLIFLLPFILFLYGIFFHKDDDKLPKNDKKPTREDQRKTRRAIKKLLRKKGFDEKQIREVIGDEDT